MTYSIDHKKYSKKELLDWADNLLQSENKDSWKWDIASFIVDWMSDNETLDLLTSGTTGTSKQLTVKKSAMIASAEITNTFFALDHTKTALLSLPARFIAGKMMIVRALISGMNLTLVKPSISPLAKTPSIRIDFCPLTPMQVQKSLIQNPKELKSIGAIIIGGAPISMALEKDIIQHLPNAYATFGMTETLSHIALRKITKNNFLFKALPGVRFETNKNEGFESCLIIHAPHIQSDPIHTTDIVSLVDDQNFKWKGRKDLIINSGGIKINPEEIEQKLHSLFPKNAFFVHSKPDDLLGQKVILVVEDPNHQIIVVEKLAQMKRLLPTHYTPKEIIVVAQLQRTPTNKIIRKL